ncbi:hypothetical protein AB4Z01_20150 [Inquilinus sp. YAF38]|uniref:hypothetical protein n=1 Tax=Inquilinus sp. YAF38 TaxID=3233084 RepID=UPI003F8EA084
MPTLEPTMTRNAPLPIAPEPQPGEIPGGRDVIRQIVVTVLAVGAMAGAGLMLMDLAIDRLSSLSVLRLSGLF